MPASPLDKPERQGHAQVAVQRAVRATNWLREPWDLVSLYDRPLYDEGWGRYYYTDRLLRFGCLHRILAGKANSAAILFSRAGASRVVGYSSSTAWRPGGWDLWLGELNGEPLSRLADAIPSTGRQWLRVLRWGCTPAAVQHGSFTSTLDAERAAYRPAGARDAGSSPSANRSAPSARRHGDPTRSARTRWAATDWPLAARMARGSQAGSRPSTKASTLAR